MWLIGLMVLVVMIWLIVSLVRDTTGSIQTPSLAGPRRILDERFSRGEIDRDEYPVRLTTLERS
jgi:uncharacterized membrane protein